jgi:gluconolactonase
MAIFPGNIYSMTSSLAVFDASTLEVVCQGLGFSEGPIAMPDGTILLVDIKKQCLTRIRHDGSQELVAKVPGGPNGAAFGPDGRVYICNNGGFDWTETPLPSGQIITVGEHQADGYKGGSVQALDLGSGTLETIYTDCEISTVMSGLGPRTPKELPLPSSLRGPDDLVFDAAGGFWIADFGKSRPRDKDTTGVYYARADGSYIREKIFPLDGPNGIALSPAGDRLYVSLTFRRQLVYWELDGPGSIRPNPATIDGAYVLNAAMPGDLDSIKVDEQGNIYALTILRKKTPFCNGGVTVVSPKGEIIEFFEIALPGKCVPMPSNLCWGEPDRMTAYITCGASDMLVKVRTSIPGLSPHV